MRKWYNKARLVHYSTYSGFLIYCMAAYMSHPTLATLPVFLLLLPLTIVVTIWFAHWEAMRDLREFGDQRGFSHMTYAVIGAGVGIVAIEAIHWFIRGML
jgi:hypothetical protein